MKVPVWEHAVADDYAAVVDGLRVHQMHTRPGRYQRIQVHQPDAFLPKPGSLASLHAIEAGNPNNLALVVDVVWKITEKTRQCTELEAEVRKTAAPLSGLIQSLDTASRRD